MAELFPVTTNDYEEVATLLSTIFASSSSKNYYLDIFNFWWDKNPAFSEDMERGWTIKKGGDIKGFLGVIPTFFQLCGKQKVIFNQTYWFVAKDFRKFSMDLFYRRLNVSKNSISFSSTASPRVAAIKKARGYIPLPRITPGRSVIFFDCKNTLKKRLKNRHIPEAIINLGSFAINKFQLLRLKTALKVDSSNVREIFEIDESFDDLWKRTQNIFLNTNVRKAHILQWLCFSNKRQKIKVFAYYEDDKLWGYLILALKEYEANIWICLDLWVDPLQSKALSALITKAVQEARQERGDMIIFNHFSADIARMCKAMGMIRFPSRKNELIRISSKYKEIIQAQNSYFVVQSDAALA
jgi:hypothetical protein